MRLGTALVPASLLALWLALGGLPGSLAAPGSYHEDERLGYKVRYPKGWTSIPMNIDERWVAAKFLSDKSTIYTNKEDGWTYDHKPDMSVITFITQVVESRGVEKTDTDDGMLIEIKNPYKDYEDFLERTYSGGGWYIAEDEEGEQGGVLVRKLEIKVEKLTRSGPKRIVTWIYKTEEVDFAVQFEVLEGAYRKLKGDIYACLKSFKLIPRTGSLTPTTTGETAKPKDEDEMSPEERVTYRKQLEASFHQKAQQTLPEGWTAKQMGRFLVLNHADDRYAKKVVAHAEALWKWLDKNLAYVGEDEYMPRPIIRICKDSDEERAFFSGTSYGPSLEIVTHKDTSGGSMSWEFEWVNRRLLGLWFKYRNRDLYFVLPHWLDNGFDQVFGTARAKGSKLEFQADQWELEGLRDAVRKDEVTAIEDLVKMGTEDFYENRTRSRQSAAFIRMLLSSRSRKVKNLLQTYLMNLDGIVRRIKAEQKAEKPEAEKPPETEEEEEQRLKARRQAWKDKERELLQEVFDETFGEWSEKDWRRLNDEYRKSID